MNQKQNRESSPNKVTGKVPVRVLVGIFLLVVVGAHLTHQRDEHGRNCRICAANYQHREWKVYGIPIWFRDTEPVATADTKHYFDKYLNYSHDHEWTGGGYATYGPGVHGDGRSFFGPYPQHQRDLTRMGFRLVAVSGISDADDRRMYFESIIQPEGIDHYARVRSTFALVDDQIPKEPRSKWYHYKVWSRSMDGIDIPTVVQTGQLVPSVEP